MRVITLEDVRDVYVKLAQRGWSFILSKFSFSNKNRTKSSFNNTTIEGSNWWIVPKVRARWNYLITGDEEINYEKYITEKFKHISNLKMLSLGSGICSNELKLAQLNPNWEITCIDFSEQLIYHAKNIAAKNNLTNIKFVVNDVYKYSFPNEYYNIILFNASLHHFKNIGGFIEKFKTTLSKKGKLIINEYVGPNRLQFSKHQIKEINACLSLIDHDYRKIYKTNLYKNKYYGSGLIRMIISDPSECIDSENILPSVYKHFKIIEEKEYGGNLLMSVLKHISHHFIDLDERKTACLKRIFEYEDKYLMHNKSDFVFGIYELI